MSWRTVVIANSAKLDYQMGFLVVRGHETSKIHISEIHTLMIETTSVSLTASLLAELVKKKIKVIFCDEKKNPCSELIPYYGAHDTSAKIKMQLAWSEDIKERVWMLIVAEKIRNQAEHLALWERPEADMLYQYLKEIQPGDVSNREGHAAKVYFNALFGMDFTRTAENSVNAALNYGYGVLLSAFNREISYNGYFTQLALFHDNMFNPFNFGSDLMEPFRPIVDYYVKKLNPQKFEHEEKMHILRIMEQEVQISDKKEVLTNAIKIYSRSIFDALNEQNLELIKFYKYEL